MPIRMWFFCHCTSTYDKFLESLLHCEFSGRTFGRYKEDQEGQECLKHVILKEFGYPDVDFVIVSPHMIFMESLRHCEYSKMVSRTLVNIRKRSRMPKKGFGGFFVFFVIITPHMMPFWNSWYFIRHEYSWRVPMKFGHHQEDQEGQKCSKHVLMGIFKLCTNMY